MCSTSRIGLHSYSDMCKRFICVAFPVCVENSFIFCWVSDQVFACSLTSLCSRENTSVPNFVRMCIEHVENSGTLLCLGGVGVSRINLKHGVDFSLSLVSFFSSLFLRPPSRFLSIPLFYLQV